MNLEEASRSLPWYAVGALSAEEAAAVEAHLANSPDLRRELEELRALHGVVTAQSANEPAFRPLLIADAWKRIDEYERARGSTASEGASAVPAASAGATAPGGTTAPAGTTASESARSASRSPASLRSAASASPMALIARLVATLRSSWLDLSVTGRWALAAQFAVILVLGTVLLVPRSHSPEFQTASGTSQAVPLTGARFTVAFQPSATEEQIRSLLSALGAQVVAGPTAEQLYTIQLSDRAAPEKALAELRASAIVRFAGREGE